MAAEAVRDKEDVRIHSSLGQERSKAINADEDTRTLWLRDGKDGPAKGFAVRLIRLTHGVAAHLPPSAGSLANTPKETYQYLKCLSNNEVAGGIRVACVYDPRSCQEWHIDADWIVKRSSV